MYEWKYGFKVIFNYAHWAVPSEALYSPLNVRYKSQFANNKMKKIKTSNDEISEFSKNKIIMIYIHNNVAVRFQCSHLRCFARIVLRRVVRHRRRNVLLDKVLWINIQNIQNNTNHIVSQREFFLSLTKQCNNKNLLCFVDRFEQRFVKFDVIVLFDDMKRETTRTWTKKPKKRLIN